MKRTPIILAALILARCGAVAVGAPAPLPLVVNSQSPTAPGLSCYRASYSPVRVSFMDGTNATTITTGEVPFLSWSPTSTNSGGITSTWAAVSGMTGVVDFAWSASDLNYAPGRYFYEAGVKSNAQSRTVRHGVLTIVGSPYNTGGAAASFTTNINGALYTFTAPWSELAIPATWLTNVTAGSGITQSAADARYVARQGDYTGTVAGITASIVATSATGALARVAAVESAGYLTAALAGTTYEPTGAVARATAAAGVLFQPTGTYVTVEADTLATVLGRGNDANGGAITNVHGMTVTEEVLFVDDTRVEFGPSIDNPETYTGNGVLGNAPSTETLNWRFRQLLGDWDLGTSTNLDAASVQRGTIATARLPASLLYSNSVATTLADTAAPVSGAAVEYALTNGHLRAKFDRVDASNYVHFGGANTNTVQGWGHDVAAQGSGGYTGVRFAVHDTGWGAPWGTRVRISGGLVGSDIDIASGLCDVRLYADETALRIGEGVEGGSVAGWLTGGRVEIDDHSPGAEIRGDMAGGSSIRIGQWSMGARGQGRAYWNNPGVSRVEIGSAAAGTGAAVGSMGLFQLLDSDNGDDTTYSNQLIYAAESLGLGAVMIRTNDKQSVVVGDGLASVGRGMVNAYGYYKHGTNIFDLVTGGSGQTVSVGYTGDTLPSAVTNGSAVAVFIPTNAATGGGQTVSAGGDLVAATNGSAVAISYTRPTTMASTPWTDSLECVATGLLVYARGVVTPIAFDTEVDPGGIHAAGAWSYSSSGMVTISGSAFITKSDASQPNQVRVLRNSDVIKLGTRDILATAGTAYSEIMWSGYNDAASNVWKIGFYNGLGPTTNAAGSTLSTRYTSLSTYRMKNAGE